MDNQTLFKRNISLLLEAGIDHREFEHQPVLNYEQARAVREKHHLPGVESKSLFIQLKDSRYCMFVSVEGKRLNPKLVRDLLGSKPRICSDEELSKITGCVPKCACPFGHPDEVTLIVDFDIFQHDSFLYSPGPPEKTIEIYTKDIHKLLKIMNNPIVYYKDE